VNVVSGFGPTAGAALASHMDVDKVSNSCIFLIEDWQNNNTYAMSNHIFLSFNKACIHWIYRHWKNCT